VLTAVTGQLGFWLSLESERQRLEQLRLVRVSSERVMAVLVTKAARCARACSTSAS
jgi:transcriptional regulator of heat shock response